MAEPHVPDVNSRFASNYDTPLYSGRPWMQQLVRRDMGEHVGIVVADRAALNVAMVHDFDDEPVTDVGDLTVLGTNDTLALARHLRTYYTVDRVEDSEPAIWATMVDHVGLYAGVDDPAHRGEIAPKKVDLYAVDLEHEVVQIVPHYDRGDDLTPAELHFDLIRFGLEETVSVKVHDFFRSRLAHLARVSGHPKTS